MSVDQSESLHAEAVSAETISKRRRWLFILPALVTFALFAVFYVGLSLDPRKIESPLIDRAAPEFSLPGLSPSDPGLSTADLATGDVLVLNFFASWCVPCRVEHPLLTRIARDEGVTVHGIAWKNEAADAKQWLDALGNPFTQIGLDLENKAGIEWGVYGVPETYILDATGRIRHKHVGPLNPVDLEETFLPIIAELKQ